MRFCVLLFSLAFVATIAVCSDVSLVRHFRCRALQCNATTECCAGDRRSPPSCTPLALVGQPCRRFFRTRLYSRYCRCSAGLVCTRQNVCVARGTTSGTTSTTTSGTTATTTSTTTSTTPAPVT
uniref:U17-Hexatoxin-Hf1a_1 n=1 Tax=Hadronyche formidabilis TaxID=426499 RepID=A0A4Q8K589_HADFO